jgi:5-methylcytosine-specific restriction endonuclease McrA
VIGKPARKIEGGWVNRRDLPKGTNGRNLCRWCNLEVPSGRRTFCSSFCVHEWRLRSDPGYLRDKVFERDRGVCAQCGVDTLELRKRKRKLGYAERLTFEREWGKRKTLWDADHVVPVAEGGGECDLDNMRTLCLLCHRRVTAELRTRLKQPGLPPRQP